MHDFAELCKDEIMYIKSLENEDQYICLVMQNLINQLKQRNIPLAESRISDYHFHEFYFRVNASPEIIKNTAHRKLSGCTFRFRPP